MVELIVFDCDGTLVLSLDAKDKAFEYIGSLVSPEAGKALRAWHKNNGGVNRTEKFAWLYDNFVGRPISREESDRLSALFDEHCAAALKDVQLVPGTMEVLEKWHGKIPMCVASAAPQGGVEQLLRLKGIDGYFNKIYGYPPGKTEQLRKAISDSGAASLTTVMVGDSQKDLEAANTLDTMFYGVGDTLKNCSVPCHGDLTRFNDWLSGQLD